VTASAKPGKRVRVAHLITELNVGGAENMLCRLVESSEVATSLDTVVISLESGGELAGRIAAAGVGVYNLGLAAGSLDPRGVWRLVRLLRRVNPDVLQTWLYSADLAGLAASLLMRGPRLAWNIRCAQLDPAEHTRLLKLLLPVLAAASGRPDAVVANSLAGRVAHERIGYHPRRWDIIPNGFDTEAFKPLPSAGVDVRQELGLPDDALLIGHVGRVHPIKDHDTLLRAVATVFRSVDRAHLLLIGRGTDTSSLIAGLGAGLGLGTRLHALGERRDTARLLAALDVAVSSSHSEGFPNVIGEAMACGIPCAVTDAGDSAALLGDGGVVVPPRNPDALAEAILQLFRMEASARRAMGEAGRARIVREFSLPTIARRYVDLYMELAGGQAICAA
jgi:glycosyltransferase involved in cell wall biosynthesis